MTGIKRFLVGWWIGTGLVIVFAIPHVLPLSWLEFGIGCVYSWAMVATAWVAFTEDRR